jgi:hypothetical protein
VSTFYLLPSRPVVGERFARYLGGLFPGLEWAAADWNELGDLLGALAARRPDVFVIYGEELPPGADPAHTLAEGVGAEAGDVVVEIQPAADARHVTAQTWQFDPDRDPSEND